MTPSEKRAALIKAGHENLHIIADFDGTLTKGFIDGKKVHSSYAIIRDSELLDPEFAALDYALFEKYYPFENDLSLTLEQRKEKMVEWWNTHWDMYVEHKLPEAIIKPLEDSVHFRAGVEELFSLTEQQNIPFLILSAGFGNIIEYALQKKQLIKENMHILINRMVFENGVAASYNTPLIHCLNKDEEHVRGTPFEEEIKERTHVLLLGDHAGDASMADGMDHELVFKIGFLNGKKEREAEMRKVYDILIEEDSDLSYVIDLLNEVSKTDNL